MLMKKTVLMVVAALVCACGLEEVSVRPQEGNAWIRPGVGGESGKTDVYVTALDYPDDYNWRVDSEKGSVKCSLIVYQNGNPYMKVPVGDEYEISSDPDMHRMENGHLYTDFSTDSETVIKRDGKVVARYAGREMICDLLEYEDDVYTLGHSRDGAGFTYRKNGEILLERAGGRSFGTLHYSGDTIAFAFMETIGSAEASIERYYLSVNAEVRQTAVREDVKKVWDIIPYKDEVCYLASVVGVPSPVLFRGDRMQALDMPGSNMMLASRIVAEDAGALFVEGLFQTQDKLLGGGLWDENGKAHIFDGGMTVSSICMGGTGVCCVLNSSSSSGGGLIYRCGETFSIPEGYTSFGNSPIALIGGILHVGLSSLTGTQPLLWKDGETIPFKINGFITGIAADKGK